MNKQLLARFFAARDHAQTIADRLLAHRIQLVNEGDTSAWTMRQIALLDANRDGVIVTRDYYQFRIDELHAQHPVSPHYLPGDHRNLQ